MLPFPIFAETMLEETIDLAFVGGINEEIENEEEENEEYLSEE